MFKIYKFILEFIKKPIINSFDCLNIWIIFDMNFFRIQCINSNDIKLTLKRQNPASAKADVLIILSPPTPKTAPS